MKARRVCDAGSSAAIIVVAVVVIIEPQRRCAAGRSAAIVIIIVISTIIIFVVAAAVMSTTIVFGRTASFGADPRAKNVNLLLANGVYLSAPSEGIFGHPYRAILGGISIESKGGAIHQFLVAQHEKFVRDLLFLILVLVLVR